VLNCSVDELIDFEEMIEWVASQTFSFMKEVVLWVELDLGY
jgi:hypothetical protein